MMRRMLKLVYPAAPVCGLAALLMLTAGCNRGPLLDPDVMDKKDLPSNIQKVYYEKISGTLQDVDGNPVKGAEVVVQSSQGSWSDVTTHFGNFRLEALVSNGDPLFFHFTPAKQSWTPAQVKWTVRVYDHELPKGVKQYQLHFQVQRDGTVRLTSVEY